MQFRTFLFNRQWAIGYFGSWLEARGPGRLEYFRGGITTSGLTKIRQNNKVELGCTNIIIELSINAQMR